MSRPTLPATLTSSRFPPGPPSGSGGDRESTPHQSFAGPDPPRALPLFVSFVFDSGLPWPSPFGCAFGASKTALLRFCRIAACLCVARRQVRSCLRRPACCAVRSAGRGFCRQVFQPAVNGNLPEAPMAANLLAWDFAFSNELVESRFRYLQVGRQLCNGQDIAWFFIHRNHLHSRGREVWPQGRFRIIVPHPTSIISVSDSWCQEISGMRHTYARQKPSVSRKA